MKIKQLRDFAVKNNINVIGTGKRDGEITRKDFILACETHQEKYMKIKNDELKAKVDLIYNTSDGLAEVVNSYILISVLEQESIRMNKSDKNTTGNIFFISNN